VILPTASSLPDCGEDYAEELAKLGLRSPAQILPVRNREAAYCPDYCQVMEEATGLFITGGDQARLWAAARLRSWMAAR
jgi:cyanophycinase